MRKLTFANAYQLASWINNNIVDIILQENLMLEGIRNKYTIYVNEQLN